MMNDFKTDWQSLNKQGKHYLADRMETAIAYLSQLAHGHRQGGKIFKRVLVSEVEAMRKKQEYWKN